MVPSSLSHLTDKDFTDAFFSVLKDRNAREIVLRSFGECMQEIPICRQLAQYKDVSNDAYIRLCL